MVSRHAWAWKATHFRADKGGCGCSLVGVTERVAGRDFKQPFMVGGLTVEP